MEQTSAHVSLLTITLQQNKKKGKNPYQIFFIPPGKLTRANDRLDHLIGLSVACCFKKCKHPPVLSGSDLCAPLYRARITRLGNWAAGTNRIWVLPSLHASSKLTTVTGGLGSKNRMLLSSESFGAELWREQGAHTWVHHLCRADLQTGEGKLVAINRCLSPSPTLAAKADDGTRLPDFIFLRPLIYSDDGTQVSDLLSFDLSTFYMPPPDCLCNPDYLDQV
ncbi:hypothetical protein NPIL_81631 [Nephila pilipes]|uniref:Uncharacterized protein n=1 Tax=Nephila pilipes TaxID=299642 RepID=A0A8X6QQX8_NEPPI|nr:hypothetical protein NPIL_81631 [Nephila pilipes]